MINIETESPLAIFKSVSVEYGSAFYEINTFLRQLNNGMGRLSIFDINTIQNRAKDKKDNVSVAVMTLDYLLRQSLSLLIEADKESLSVLLANFICTSFSLDKQNSSVLMHVAKTYYAFNLQ